MKRSTRILSLAVSCTLSVCMVSAALALPTHALFGRRSAAEPAVQTFAKSAGAGDTVTFSQSDFEARVTGGDDLAGIVISELPDAACGVLRLAGRDITRGETIDLSGLNALSFAPAGDADIHTGFSFIPVFADAGADSGSVSVAINLSATPDSAPIARDLAFETYPDLPLCGDFSSVDPDGDGCTYNIVTEPQHGTVSLTGGGFCYTPDGQTGNDRFTYLAIDAYGNPSTAASVSIEVRKRPSTGGITYTDMAQSTAHYAAVRLAEAGVLSGERIGSESFLHPDLPVSRAEFVTMAAAAVELPLPTAAVSTGLADNEAIPVWAQPYIAAAVSAGVVYGQKGDDGNHVFRAQDTITRAEAAGIIQRAARMTIDGRTLAFEDAASVPAWAVPAVTTVAAAGILDTYADNTVRAADPVTREDAVKMLYRTMLYLAEKNDGPLAD